MEWLFLQGRIAEDVAFVLHVDALVYVSYIKLLLTFLSICYTSVSLG